MTSPRFLIIEPCDFVAFPSGGQLTTAKQLMRAFGPAVGLVGFTSDDSTPVGQWVEREFFGQKHAFYAYGRWKPAAARPLIPGRLKAYFQLLAHRRRILEAGRLPAFVQAFEALLAVSSWGLPSICYRFPGVANCLHHSRYSYAKYFAAALDAAMFRALKKVDVVLASADAAAIKGLTDRSKGSLDPSRVIQSPTRVDTEVFKPESSEGARIKLGMPINGPLYVVSGRIGAYKGWPFVLDSFETLLKRIPDANLVFVGDGEDGELLRNEIVSRGLGARARVTGFIRPPEVALWLNAADAAVSGSLLEGWSLAMLEVLACGKPLVTTPVSGVADMVVDGTNGFIVKQRDPGVFAAAMQAALELPDAAATSHRIAQRYAVKNLRSDLLAVWPALRARMEGSAGMPSQEPPLPSTRKLSLVEAPE